MAASKLRFTSFKLLRNISFNASTTASKLRYCTTTAGNEGQSEDKKLGFVKFGEKKAELLEKPKTEDETFVSLLRNSEFINLGDPVGKEVIGVVYHVVEDDLYIDFGWKFPTVCPVPAHNKRLYVPGTKVKLLIKDLELSTRFLGGDGEITLLEADCLLLGLAEKSPGYRGGSATQSRGVIVGPPFAVVSNTAQLAEDIWLKNNSLNKFKPKIN